VIISSLDMFKMQFTCCIKTKRSNIIKQSMNYIDSSLDEESFAFNNINDHILRKVLLDKDKNDLLIIPSININNEKACEMFFKETLRVLRVNNDNEIENDKDKYDIDRIESKDIDNIDINKNKDIIEENMSEYLIEKFIRLLNLDPKEENLTLLKLFLMSNI